MMHCPAALVLSLTIAFPPQLTAQERSAIAAALPALNRLVQVFGEEPHV